MEELWSQLGIEPTGDRKTVKRAYAARLKTIDAEQDPQSFQILREAYECILESLNQDETEYGILEDAPIFEEAIDRPTDAPIDHQEDRVSALDWAETLCHLCEQGNESEAVQQLHKDRGSDLYAEDETFRETYELYVMVGLLENDWSTFPFDLARQVQLPWSQDPLTPDHPFFQEKWELTQKIVAEDLRTEITIALAKSPEEPLSEFDKAARTLFTEIASLHNYPVLRRRKHFRRIIIAISEDFTGTFEDWIHNNHYWKKWIDFETFMIKQVRKRILCWLLSALVTYWFCRLVLEIDYFSSFIILIVLLCLVEANTWHARWRERRFQPKFHGADQTRDYGTRYQP